MTDPRQPDSPIAGEREPSPERERTQRRRRIEPNSVVGSNPFPAPDGTRSVPIGRESPASRLVAGAVRLYSGAIGRAGAAGMDLQRRMTNLMSAKTRRLRDVLPGPGWPGRCSGPGRRGRRPAGRLLRVPPAGGLQARQPDHRPAGPRPRRRQGRGHRGHQQRPVADRPAPEHQEARRRGRGPGGGRRRSTRSPATAGCGWSACRSTRRSSASRPATSTATARPTWSITATRPGIEILYNRGERPVRRRQEDQHRRGRRGCPGPSPSATSTATAATTWPC